MKTPRDMYVEACTDLCLATGSQIVDYQEGRFSGVVRCDSTDELYPASYAVKCLPEDPSNKAYHMSVTMLSDEHNTLKAFEHAKEQIPPPLIIPESLDDFCIGHIRKNQLGKLAAAHITTTWVPGENLGDKQVRGFNQQEQQTLGEAAVQFVKWNTHVPLGLEVENKDSDIYIARNTIKNPDLHPALQFYDKERSLQLSSVSLRQIHDAGFPDFARFMNRLLGDYHTLDVAFTAPDFLGHNDFRVGNSTFVQKDGLWQLQGVFDMGIALASTPERELRHWASISEAVRLAILNAYNQDGDELNEAHLLFWAKTQNAIYILETLLRNGVRAIADRERPLDAVHALRNLCPGRDFPELEPFFDPEKAAPAVVIASASSQARPRRTIGLDS